MVDFNFKSFYVSADQPWTILDKTVEQIVYLDSIFLNIVAVPVLLSTPSPESNVVVYSKESLIPGRLWEATLNWGKGFSFLKGVVLEIVSLRRKVDMMGKTFSSSFVRDCSFDCCKRPIMPNGGSRFQGFVPCPTDELDDGNKLNERTSDWWGSFVSKTVIEEA